MKPQAKNHSVPNLAVISFFIQTSQLIKKKNLNLVYKLELNKKMSSSSTTTKRRRKKISGFGKLVFKLEGFYSKHKA